MSLTVEIPAERIEMQHDAHRMESFKNAAANILPWLNDLIEAYELQGIEEPVSMEAIKAMLHNAPDYIKEKALGNEVMMIGKVKVSREQAKNMLDLPNLHLIIKPVDNLKHALYTFRSGHYSGLEVFEIKKGRAVVSEKALQERSERATIYAETDAEKEAWLVVQEIKQRLEYLNEKYGITAIDGANNTSILRQVNEYKSGMKVYIDANQLKRRVNKRPY